MTLRSNCDIGESLPGRGQVFFLEADLYAAIREAKDHLAKIVQVAGQPIHRVAYHCIAFTHVARQLLQLRRVEILPEALSTKRLSSLEPSSCRSSF